MSWIEKIGKLGPTPQHHLGGKGATEKLIGLADIKDGQEILVLGCGDGETAISVARMYDCKVIGTDINPIAIKEANNCLYRNRRRLKGNIVFKIDDLLKSELPKNSFDRVIVESVLIMLPKDEALNVIHSLLVPGGILAINEGIRLSGNMLYIAS